MITASSKFVDALAYSHTSLVRVTIDDVVAPISTGTIVCDWTRDVRRTGTLRIADDILLPNLVPSITTSSVAVIEKGIRFLDGTEEYVTIATLRVQDLTKTMSNEYVDIVLSDDGQLVEDYPLVFPWSPTEDGSATVVDAIKLIIEDALPEVPTWSVDLDTGLDTTLVADGLLYASGTSRWAIVNELGLAISAQVYPEVDGTWTIKQIRNDTTTVHDVAGGAGGVLVDATGRASRRDVFNAVVIEWGTTDVPGGIVLVTDNDATSPTYWDGSWGKTPKRAARLPVTTEAEAISAGVAELQLVKGAQSGLDLTTVYNPLLESGDVIGVTQTGEAREVHIVDSLTYDLTGAMMTAKTRVVSVS